MDSDNPDPADELGLEVTLGDVWKAFEFAGPYASGKSNTEKLENRWELAACFLDKALMLTDRGVHLMEVEAELAYKRKSGGGSITLQGPFDLG